MKPVLRDHLTVHIIGTFDRNGGIYFDCTLIKFVHSEKVLKFFVDTQHCPIATKNIWLIHTGSGHYLSPCKETVFNRRALVMTDTELKLMAAAANMGDSNKTKKGYRIPAATGTPTLL